MKQQERVLIFGTRGQVGLELVKSAPERFKLFQFDRHSVDLTDEDAIRESIRSIAPSLIIIAAAYTAVDKAESDRELATAVNTVAPLIIGEEASRLGCRVIHYSTDYVFDGRACEPYQPRAAKNPLSVYGRTKSDGEDALLKVVAPEKLLILRTAWVYSNQGHNFVNTMLGLMQTRDTLRVVADQLGTPTSAKSIAGATWEAVDAGVNGLHHFTDAGVASWYDFACAIERTVAKAGVLLRRVRIEPISSSEYNQVAQRPLFGLLNKKSFWESSRVQPIHWMDTLEIHLKTYSRS